jgi:hypothetical protein
MSLVALLPLAWVRKPHLLAEPLAEIAALDEKRRIAWKAAVSGVGLALAEPDRTLVWIVSQWVSN